MSTDLYQAAMERHEKKREAREAGEMKAEAINSHLAKYEELQALALEAIEASQRPELFNEARQIDLLRASVYANLAGSAARIAVEFSKE